LIRKYNLSNIYLIDVNDEDVLVWFKVVITIFEVNVVGWISFKSF